MNTQTQNTATPPVRGMAAASIRAQQDVAAGKKISGCPYRDKAWRSAWMTGFMAAQQLDLFGGH